MEREVYSLGIELGSTRIKAVLTDGAHRIAAQGWYEWNNSYIDGIWTYTLEEVRTGLQKAYRSLKDDYLQKFGTPMGSPDCIGVSAMMHGYLPFDREGRQIAMFRTWRNTITEEEADELTEAFRFNIPQRWSVAHLYRSVRHREEHVDRIDFLTTLAGYVHWKLTGRRVLGINDASGMFPIDIASGDYDQRMIDVFESMTAGALPKKLREILPEVLRAGDPAGTLTEEGARFLDPSGELKSGIPLCPPEGDAGTGMAATNSVRKRTGNISAGTSIFGMIVLENNLSRVYRELDLCCTPDGSLTAMAHCNNCTSDLDAWMGVFDELLQLFGAGTDKAGLYGRLFGKSLEGDADCGKILTYNYLSGEHVTGLNEGRPMVLRRPDSRFSLANFLRAQLYSCFGALKTGMDILLKEEKVPLAGVTAHGGMFKTPGVAPRSLAAALNTPVTVMDSAGEGGAYGISLLAMYAQRKGQRETLPDYLDKNVFASVRKTTAEPLPEEAEGFEAFAKSYQDCLAVEKEACRRF